MDTLPIKPEHTPPAVGSLWKAKDGRILLVESVAASTSARSGGKAVLRVLSPLSLRQRTMTNMAFDCFGGFLERIPYEALVQHDPALGSYDAMIFPYLYRFLKGRGLSEMTEHARKMGVDLRFRPVGGPMTTAYFGNAELLAHVRENELPEWLEGGMQWVGAWLNEDNEVTSIYARSVD